MKGGKDVTTHEVIVDQVHQHHGVNTLLKKMKLPRAAIVQPLPPAAPKGKRLVLPDIKRLGVHYSGLHNLSPGEHAPGYGIHVCRALIVGAFVSSTVHGVVGYALEISKNFN